MTEAHNAMMVRCVVEAIWNQGDLDAADLLFTADYVNHAGLIADLVRGPEAIKISVAFYRTAFPDLQITIDELTAKRDAVLLRWTASSTPLISSVTNRTRGRLRGMIVCRFVRGRIAESWMHWDQPGVLKQLGLVRRAEPAGRG